MSCAYAAAMARAMHRAAMAGFYNVGGVLLRPLRAGQAPKDFRGLMHLRDAGDLNPIADLLANADRAAAPD